MREGREGTTKSWLGREVAGLSPLRHLSEGVVAPRWGVEYAFSVVKSLVFHATSFFNLSNDLKEYSVSFEINYKSVIITNSLK